MRTRSILSLFLVATLAFGGWVGTAAAAEVILHMKDGRRIKGELVSQDADNVTIKIGTISTPFPKDGILRIEEQKTLKELAAEWLTGVAPNDAEKRLAVARRIYDYKPEGIVTREFQLEKFRLASKHFRDVLRIDPNQEQAKALLEASEAWVKHFEGEVAPPPPPPPPPNPIDDPPPPVGPLPTERLTDQDINWLRLFEYDFRERSKPNVNVSNEVLDQLFANHADDPLVPKGNAARQDLRRKQGFEKLDLLFQVRDRSLWGQAEVNGDPQAFRTFKTTIHRNYVLNYCATAECHGGPKAGKLFLFRDEPVSDRTVYTNFYILNQYRSADGGYMIDRDRPEMSLLMQYGMPHDRAALKHPDVPGWAPNGAMVAANPTRGLYGQMVSWISKELYAPAPRYDEVVKYRPPSVGGGAAPPADATTDGAAKAPAGGQ